MKAIFKNNLFKFRQSIASGADVNQASQGSHAMPLIAAAFTGNPTMINELLDLKVPIDAVNLDGDTALMWATNEESINALINRGADVTKANHQGNTALHYLLYNRSVYTPSAVARLVEHYLAAGANQEAVNDRGDTPVSLANEQGDTVLSAIFSHANTRLQTPVDTRLLPGDAVFTTASQPAPFFLGLFNALRDGFSAMTGKLWHSVQWLDRLGVTSSNGQVAPITGGDFRQQIAALTERQNTALPPERGYRTPWSLAGQFPSSNLSHASLVPGIQGH